MTATAAAAGSRVNLGRATRWESLFQLFGFSVFLSPTATTFRDPLLSAVLGDDDLRRVQHWGSWFRLFGVYDEKACSQQSVSQGYREAMRKYRPANFKDAPQCGQLMRLIVNAGKELLKGHPACAAATNDVPAKKPRAFHHDLPLY
jgi:hypothetical protein